MKTSKIATIIYNNYTENVDMLNPLFKQSELDNLIKTDKDIIRVDYYINGVLVGNKMYTANQAISQIKKMEETQAKLYGQRKMECGPDWLKNCNFNEKLDEKISDLYNKQEFYKQFLTKEDFDQSDLPFIMCCDWEDFISNINIHQ